MEKILEGLLTEGFDWDRTYNDSLEGIFVLNYDHEVVKVNTTMLRMLGLHSQAEISGKKCYEILHGTSVPPAECVHAKVVHSNHVEETEVSRYGRIYHIVETPLFSKKGHIVGYTHSAYDITEQKQAEQLMKESREKFETIFTKFPIGILIANLGSGEILDANDYFCEMLNYSKAELTKLTIYDITHPDDFKLSKEHSSRASVDGLSYRITKRYITKFGQIRWVYVAVAPVMDSNSKVGYAFSMVEDITDKVFSQREIDRQKDLLRSYVDLVRVIIVSLDVQGRITMINRRGRELLGKEEKELLGKNWFMNYVPERERVRVTEIFQQLMRGEISLNGDPPNYFTNPLKIKGGKESLILWHNTLLRDSDGKICGVLSAGEDITKDNE
jgi:PAS domain S-box-containing protein